MAIGLRVSELGARLRQDPALILKSLWGQSAIALTFRVLSLVLGLIIHASLPKWLGLKGYGQYALAMSWTTTLEIFFRFGLDGATLRFVPQYRAQREFGLLRGYLRFLRNSSCALSVLGGCSLAFLVWLQGERIDPVLRECIFLSSLILPLFCFSHIRDALLRTFNAVIPSMISEPIRQSLLLIIIFAGLLGGMFSPSPQFAIGAYGIACLLAFVVGILLLRCYLEQHPENPEEYRVGEWLASCGWRTGIASCRMVQTTSGLLIAGLLLTIDQVGLLSVLISLASFTLLGSGSVVWVFTPRITAAYGSNSELAQKNILRRFTWAFLGAIVPLALVLVLAGGPILSWFGPEFRACYPSLILLVGGCFLSALGAAMLVVPNAVGKERWSLFVMASALGLQIILIFLFTPRWGIIGVASAYLAAGVLRLLGAWLLLHQHRQKDFKVSAVSV